MEYEGNGEDLSPCKWPAVILAAKVRISGMEECNSPEHRNGNKLEKFLQDAK